jgi:hypothetical protein
MGSINKQVLTCKLIIYGLTTMYFDERDLTISFINVTGLCRANEKDKK